MIRDDKTNPDLWDEKASKMLEQVRNSPPPSLGQMAVNFATSMSQWASKGFKMATEKTRKERFATCEKCDFWKPKNFGGMGQCLKCGCSGAKMHLATSSCPIGKWGSEELDKS